jgi:histidinol-phosphate aminotransferase
MSKYWSKLVEGLEPYVPGEQPKDKKYIKLNTNENPYGPSPRVLKAIKEAVNDDLKLYPDSNCDDLISAIAQYYNVDKSHVFPGNGSDEVLAFAFAAFFDSDREILFPDVTYSFYPVYANLYNLKYSLVPLDENFDIRAQDYYGSPGGVIIANPNAPTGKLLTLTSIRDILENNPDRVVIIDEAYIDFGGESAIPLIDEYPNLLVIQTLSKSRSLAGMRIGFAIGDSSLIEALNRVKNSFNSYTLDRLAIKAGIEAFKDEEYFQKCRSMIISSRERVTIKMKAMSFNVLESYANFIFASHIEKKADQLFKELKENGILVRYFNKPKINNYLRISIGSDEEMDSFLEILEQMVHG